MIIEQTLSQPYKHYFWKRFFLFFIPLMMVGIRFEPMIIQNPFEKFGDYGRVQIRKPKDDRDTKVDLIETIKVKSKNNNTKPGLDAAKAYMQNKDYITLQNILPGAKKPLTLKIDKFGHMLYRHDHRY